jgi:hypothetical protein
MRPTKGSPCPKDILHIETRLVRIREALYSEVRGESVLPNRLRERDAFSSDSET